MPDFPQNWSRWLFLIIGVALIFLANDVPGKLANRFRGNKIDAINKLLSDKNRLRGIIGADDEFLPMFLSIKVDAIFAKLLSDKFFELTIKVFNGAMFPIRFYEDYIGSIKYNDQRIAFKPAMTAIERKFLIRPASTTITIMQQLPNDIADKVRDSLVSGEIVSFNLTELNINYESIDNKKPLRKFRLSLPEQIHCRQGTMTWR